MENNSKCVWGTLLCECMLSAIDKKFFSKRHFRYEVQMIDEMICIFAHHKRLSSHTVQSVKESSSRRLIFICIRNMNQGTLENAL